MTFQNRIVVSAKRWLGTPYRHQASVLGAGCDCLGLVRGVWRDICGEEPTVTPEYPIDLRQDFAADRLECAAKKFLIARDGTPRIGDIILFQLLRNYPPRHCGILVGDKQFIHAQERLGVVEANLTDGWKNRVSGIYSFPHRAH